MKPEVHSGILFGVFLAFCVLTICLVVISWGPRPKH